MQSHSVPRKSSTSAVDSARELFVTLLDSIKMDCALISGLLEDSQPELRSNYQHSPNRGLTVQGIATSTTAGVISTGLPNEAGAVISKIEDIFDSITSCLLDEKKELSIRLKTRGKPGTREYDHFTGTVKSLPSSEARMIKFPSNSPQEAWKFSA